MRQYYPFVLLFYGVFVPNILGFPHVNTSIDCDSMLPHYEGEAQKSPPPYLITTSFDSYDPGNEIEVTLHGNDKSGFQGFLLQAREVDGDAPVGTFKITDPNTQGLSCNNVSNSAVSHINSDVKNKVTTIWVAPSKAKDVRFSATFVKDLENFWAGIESKTLSPRNSESRNVTARSKKKSANTVIVACKQTGGTYSSSGKCIQGGSSGSSSSGSSGSQTIYISSESSGSRPQDGVVYPVRGGGCGPGGAAGVYGIYGCRGDGSSFNSGISYGHSVPSGSKETSVKITSYAESGPYPAERQTYPQSLSGSGYQVYVQGGQSYQGGSISYGQGGNSGSYNPVREGSPSVSITYGKGGQTYPGSSGSYGQQGGSSSSGSSGCGKGAPYDSSSCYESQSTSSQDSSNQSGSSSSQGSSGCQNDGNSDSDSSNRCPQGGSSQNSGSQDSQSNSGSSSSSCGESSSGCGNSKVVARDLSHVLHIRSLSEQNEPATSNSRDKNTQDGSFIAHSDSSRGQGGCVCPGDSRSPVQYGPSPQSSNQSDDKGSSSSGGIQSVERSSSSSEGSQSGGQGSSGGSHSAGQASSVSGDSQSSDEEECASSKESSHESHTLLRSHPSSGDSSSSVDSQGSGREECDCSKQSSGSSSEGSQSGGQDSSSSGGSQDSGAIESSDLVRSHISRENSSSSEGSQGSGAGSSSSGGSYSSVQGPPSSGSGQSSGQSECNCPSSGSNSSSSGGSQNSGVGSSSSGGSQGSQGVTTIPSQDVCFCSYAFTWK
ncbi:PREDICTED: hornerin-like [Crocodylus porosus]|uniref:hornerin-like n=1 Tax=Crocodylus porosus TaxID=8502 RepID=UPI00093D5D42|nr:PREDICTED: hornerin-like [Crocodylus porosus]